MSKYVHRLINSALMRIPRRAESVDRDTLINTFVEVGPLLALLSSFDHQILYGRRGTGKTHALFYLADAVERRGDIAVYIDLRTIGSATGVYSDSSLPLSDRGTRLLIDVLEAIHDALLATALRDDSPIGDALFPYLDRLATVATSVEVVGEVEHETKLGDSYGLARATEAGLSVDHTGPGATLRRSSSRHRDVSTEIRMRQSGVQQHRIVFGPLGRALQEIVAFLEQRRLWILLDEWSSVPLELQPFLADLLRRSLFPVGGLTVKIAAVEKRSRFRISTELGDYIGIEVGADAAADLNLDDFMVFDRDNDRAKSFFSTLLYRHAAVFLPDEYQKTIAQNSAQFVQRAFSKRGLSELIRATEGVPRDAINLTALAAHRAFDRSIGNADVMRAARDWYLRDKEASISSKPEAKELLRLLLNEALGKRQTRAFLLERERDAADPIVQDLYDARLLHVLRHGIAAPNEPGTQYDGFVIDYGCYVSVLFELMEAAVPGLVDKDSYNKLLNRPDYVPKDSFQAIRHSVIRLDDLYRDAPKHDRSPSRREDFRHPRH